MSSFRTVLIVLALWGASFMNLEDCRRWLEEKTFHLQPETYQKSHPDWPGAVGLEIEMLPLVINEQGGVPSKVTLQGRSGSLASSLRQVAKRHHWDVKESSDRGQEPLLINVFMDQKDNLSFEPGGQLEFSSKPYECLSDAIKRTKSIQDILDRELRELAQVTLTQVGLNPWHSVDELGLQMQKPRYQAMNDYFSAISPYGPRMMRQTCTVQVNLDFGRDESTMAKRYLASLLLAPFAGAIFNNSGISERKSAGMTGLRSKVWRHMDPSRTGVPPLKHLKTHLNKSACVDTYFDFLKDARVVFVTGLDFKVIHSPTTWSDWVSCGIDGVFPTQDDFETHMSLLFPDVRARGFLELRSVDCQARPWQFVPAAWWTGLLYDAKACDAVIETLLPHENQMDELLDAAAFGLQDHRLAEGAKSLFTLAREGLARLPGCYYGEGALQGLERFAEAFTLRGRVPSNDLLDRMPPSGELTWEIFRRVYDDWSKAAAGIA
jgi:glutamate--cysteine ligase